MYASLVAFISCKISAIDALYRHIEDLTCFIEFIKRVGEKEIKCEACGAHYRFFATSLISSIIQEYECYTDVKKKRLI